jgi:hypothetical protein
VWKSALLTVTGLVLSTAVLATGCGGSDTARVALTDDDCTYEGDATLAPGPIEIEVENKTSHFACASVRECLLTPESRSTRRRSGLNVLGAS